MDEGVPSAKAATMNTTISATLMKVDTFWNALARSMPRRCTSAIDQTSDERESERRHARHDTREVAAEGHGRKRGGCREADRGRYPPGNEPDRAMIDPRQEVVLAARAGKCCSEFRVGEGSAQRYDAADDPQHQ